MSSFPLRGRRALVLGASGFLGTWVARELVRRGARVLAQVRDPARLAPDLGDLEVRVVDLLTPGSAAGLVRETRPDVVFSLAGYGVAKDERDEARALRLNVEVLAELVEALLAGPSLENPRLIHSGSALECGPAPASLDELAPGAPRELYGRTKSAATELLRAHHPRLTSLVGRAFTVFGPRERPGRLVPTLLAARHTRERIPLSAGTQRRDFVYVEDAARVLVELAELDGETLRAGRYPFDAPSLNLASGALTPVRDFVLALADTLGIARERLGFGDHPPLPEEMHHPPVPVDRLRAALGWSPSPDPRTGIERLAARVREGLG